MDSTTLAAYVRSISVPKGTVLDAVETPNHRFVILTMSRVDASGPQAGKRFLVQGELDPNIHGEKDARDMISRGIERLDIHTAELEAAP